MGGSVVMSVHNWRNMCILVALESAPRDHQMAACGFEKQQNQLTPGVPLTTECGSNNGEKHHLSKILWYYVYQKGQ